MKIHLRSDTHQEFRFLDSPDDGPTSAMHEADVTILAGDIHTGTKAFDYAGMLLNAIPGHIVYVAGNHEFYSSDINEVRQDLKERASVHKDLVTEGGLRFHYLENSEVIIQGVRFLGCTLWTDFLLFGEDKQNKAFFRAMMDLNDFRVIWNGEKLFHPESSVVLHKESVAWLEEKFAEPFEGKTVVVTHHAPSFGSVVPKYKDDLLSTCFASRLDHLMEVPCLWVHGHMHDSSDYVVTAANGNQCRVVCNPRGYLLRKGCYENDNWNPNLIIEI